jgi:hypothetical protein
MKSVFHLCEAFFFVAWDGETTKDECLQECLSPWNQSVHPDWIEVAEDWAALRQFGQDQTDRFGTATGHWFVLWLPLRQDRHLRKPNGTRTGAIIKRFPGDHPNQDLAFLREPDLALRLAEIMPLLHHLTSIEAEGGHDLITPFTVTLSAEERLECQGGNGTARGRIHLSNGLPALGFCGRQRMAEDDWFARLKQREDWPQTFVRDEATGEETQKADKARPEAAVLFARASDGDRLTLRWAVFLPLSDREEVISAQGAGAHVRLTLHGQFFVDSGRKDVFDWDSLFQTPPELSAQSRDEAALRRAWNAGLFQRVLGPLALADFVQSQGLSDPECSGLTAAIAKTQVYRRGQAFLCEGQAWCRFLDEQSGGQWRRIEGADLERLRPLPAPYQSEPDRPWSVFPGLRAMGLLAFDSAAPRLGAPAARWPEDELRTLLGSVEGILTDGTRMDYLQNFLDDPLCARPYLGTDGPDWLQRRLIGLLRKALLGADPARWGAHREKVRRLIALVQPERRHLIDTDLPPSVWRNLLRVDTPHLLVPQGFDVPGSSSGLKAEGSVLLPWLEILDQAVAGLTDDGAMEPLLKAASGLLKTLPQQQRGTFLRVHPELRIISVRDVGGKCARAVSLRDLERIRSTGALFSLVGGVGGGQFGLAPLLAPVLPDAEVWLIQADRYREFVDGGATLPKADTPAAVLATVAGHQGALGPLKHRRALLEKANDPGDDPQACRGLRLLLHGHPAHRDDDTTDLWVSRQAQHPAWAKLWQQLHGDADWSLLDRDLAGCLPANGWPQARIKEIAPETLLGELRQGRGIPNAAALQVEERDEILSQISDRDLWQRLPLHTRFADEEPVTLSGPTTAYLAPATGCPADALTRAAQIIRRSDNPLQAANQARTGWLRPLDNRALIEIAIRSTSPADHWRVVLDALGRLPDADIADLTSTLRGAAWLPTRFGAPVNPEDVLDLPAALRDDAGRLVAAHRAEHGPCFAVPDELADAVRLHPAIERLRINAFSRELAGLERLTLLLQDLPVQHIGDWTQQPATAMVALLADYQPMPGWRLLRDASTAFADRGDAGAIWHKLRGGLTGALDADRLFAVMDWLTSGTSDWATRKDAVNGYLRQFVALTSRPPDWFGGLRLASQADTWCAPQDLCAGAAGVDPARVLDEGQALMLAGLVKRADQRPDFGAAQSASDTAGFEQAQQAAPGVFENAFASWRGLAEPAMVGVIAGLLGVGLRETASNWLHPHTFDGLKDRLQPAWRDPGQDNVGTLQWMGGCSLVAALDLIATGLVLTDGDAVEHVNLLGSPLRVPLQSVERIDHLIAGAPAWKGGYRVLLRLRRIDPAAQRPDRLADLLRRTAEYLYGHFYNQRKPDFGALWQELENTRQLDIATARRMILDNVPFYLGQLSIRNAILKGLLDRCENAQQRLAELEEDRAGAGNPAWQQARNEARAALEDLARRIETEGALSDTVLAGVRSRISDSQYRPASIPFELFQNADDAAVELGQIQAHPDSNGCDIPDAARRLIVETGSGWLRVLHWGRPLNDRGPAGFNGDDRGFGRDLKKMLVLSASDKRPEAGVTGRLGLGFKSVLLVCDRPRIVSGRLAVEIVGGLLPTPWEDCAEARECLRTHGADQPTLPGTLIELAPVDGAEQDEVLTRFKRLAGVLCVFGRAIRRIELHGTGDATIQLRRWLPETLTDHDGLELGGLDLASKAWDTQTHALCVRTGHGSLLFALGLDGFRPLPDEVPAVWVTAPTAESAPLGFAINGPFTLDPGRAHLAADNAENLKRARMIGRGAGDQLARLLDAATQDWSGMRSRLQLAADLSVHDFWRGVWLGLTGAWLGRQPDAAGELARAAVLALIKTLADRPGTIPNGLPEPLGQMVGKRQVGYELARPLASAQVVAVLAAWARFTGQFPASRLVAPAIGEILKHADLARLAPLGPAALLKLPTANQVEPADASVLGQIIGLTGEQIPWDKGELRDALHGLRFRTAADTWSEGRRLLTDAGRPGRDGDEERLRFAIAPPARRLHGNYAAEPGGAAIQFFLDCRGRMEAPPQDLAQWVLMADETLQGAALRLLARTDSRGEVAPLVRGKGWLESVLNQESLLQAAQLTDADIDQLQRLLVSRDALSWVIQPDGNPPPDPSVRWAIDLRTGLERIFEWWAQEPVIRGKAYRERLYPWEIAAKLKEGAESDKFDRSAWLTLFSLGAFQSLQWGGRNDDRNRVFLNLCQDRGWWHTFAEVDPREQPEQWMDIIEDYAKGQHSDQEWFLWIAQFPNLYRLARWLDDYVGLFRSIARFSEPFRIETVLASRISNIYGGGGYDAPPINRTMKTGVHLIIRELLHHGVLENRHAYRHAYALTDPVRRLFASFGETIISPEQIHEMLVKHLDPAKAKFHGDYDIPLRLVAADAGLQARLFGQAW